MILEERMVESNPFVDVATYLFLEDLASNVGVEGLNTYLVNLALNLGSSMPEEVYKDWDEFLCHLRDGTSILSAFEQIKTVTDSCMVTTRSPFEQGWREYVKRVGSFSEVHNRVAEYYNSKFRGTAVNSLHVVHHSFRSAAVRRIRVGGKDVRYSQIATVWVDGEKRLAEPEVRKALLKKAGISETQLNMYLRTNSDVWLLYPE